MVHKARGFTLIELALVIAVLGILVVPLMQVLQKGGEASRVQSKTAALQNAKQALLSYALQHNGCLPHAADFEGGVVDTDAGGNGTLYTDTGSVRAAVEPATGGVGQRAGDVPWADLQLPNTGRDGDGYRLQYYVASPYTSPTQTRLTADNSATRDDCAARIRSGIESWDATARYQTGDIVTSAGAYYVATAVPAIGTAPPAANWAVFGPINPWVSASNYAVGDYVTESGNIYRALQAVNTNVTTTSTSNNGNGNSGNGNGNNGNGNGNGGSTTTTSTTTTTVAGPQPSLSPATWLRVGVPGQSTSFPAWQTGTTYRRGEIVESAGRTFRAIAATTNTTPAAGSNGPNWQDITLPPIIAGTEKLLETRVGPDIGQAPGNTASSMTNVFVLIAPGTNRDEPFNRPGMRDNHNGRAHQTCTAAGCAAWVTLNDTNVDARTFSLTADNMVGADSVLAVSFADYQAYMAEHGQTVRAVQW